MLEIKVSVCKCENFVENLWDILASFTEMRQMPVLKIETKFCTALIVQIFV